MPEQAPVLEMRKIRKVLTGVHEHDAGEILLEGKPIHPDSPFSAQKLGISTVYQEINLCPNLSVAENMFIGRQPMGLGGIGGQALQSSSLSDKPEECL